jgi:hypothetical protein
MEQRHDEKSPEHFPDGRDFIKTFADIEEYLDEEVHPNTVLGAALQNEGLLNDHGVEHVQMVIKNAYYLLKDKMKDIESGKGVDRLTGCELFMLLLAAHLHDVGNIYGREEHERRIYDVIDALGDKWTLDHPETIIITEIATAHGGHVGDDENDKDTLRLLEREDFWINIPVRPSVLASVLRFADEISDDNTRANRFLNDAGVLPEKNKLFHAYSFSLSPITITGNVIEFRYYINKEYIHNKIPVENAESIYLYDEILRRLIKCLCELEYCRKYSDGMISITTLSVEVNVMPVQGRKPIKTTKFNLKLKGYPSIDTAAFDSLAYQSGEDLDKAIQECESNA